MSEPTRIQATQEDNIAVAYAPRTAKKHRPEDCVTDTGLRLIEDAPVETIANRYETITKHLTMNPLSIPIF